MLSLGSHSLVALPSNGAREEVVRARSTRAGSLVSYKAARCPTLFCSASRCGATTAHKPLNARANSHNISTMGDRYGGGGGDGSYGGGGYGELPVPSRSQRIPSAARARRSCAPRETASGFAPEAAASQERLLLPACRAFSRSRARGCCTEKRHRRRAFSRSRPSQAAAAAATAAGSTVAAAAVSTEENTLFTT